MGRKNRPHPTPMFRVAAVDLTRPRPRYDLLGQFFSQPTVYGTPATSALPIPLMPLIRPQPQIIFPPVLPPPNLPPQKTIHDITNRIDMIKLFIVNGYHAIPVDDTPSLFNEILSKKVGLIGCDQVGHVICAGQADYETFFCFMCEFWGTPSEMFKHLEDAEHQLNYMKKFFKEKFHKVTVARRRNREELRKTFAMEISKVESNKKVVRRLNTILTVNVLFKCWPQFLSHFNNTWKEEDDDIKQIKEIINLEPPPFQSASTSSAPQRQSTSSQNIDNEEEEDKPKIDEMNLCVYALIFIRAKAITRKGIYVEEIRNICKAIGVTPEMTFSDAILGYAGIKIGSVETLVAIGKYYENPMQNLPELLRKFVKEAPSAEPPQLLLELGVEKEKAAKMVRDVAMANYTPPRNEKSTNRQPEIFYETVEIPIDGRRQISYDGDYIESPSYEKDDTFLPKRKKFE